MNKNKGIWLVIAAILLIGIAVTFATSRFIRQNGGSLDTVAVTYDQSEITALAAATLALEMLYIQAAKKGE